MIEPSALPVIWFDDAPPGGETLRRAFDETPELRIRLLRLEPMPESDRFEQGAVIILHLQKTTELAALLSLYNQIQNRACAPAPILILADLSPDLSARLLDYGVRDILPTNCPPEFLQQRIVLHRAHAHQTRQGATRDPLDSGKLYCQESAYLVSRLDSGVTIWRHQHNEPQDPLICCWLNDAANAFFVGPNNSGIWMKPQEVHPDAQEIEFYDACLDTLKHQQSVHMPPQEIQTRQGARWMEIRCLPLSADRVGVVYRDVTHLKRAVDKQTQSLQQAMQEQSDISARLQRSVEIEQAAHANQQVIHQITRLALQLAPLKDILNQALSIILALPQFNMLPKGAIFLTDDNQPDVLLLATHQGVEDSPIPTLCSAVTYGYCVCGRLAQQPETDLLITKGCSQEEDLHDLQYPEISPHGHMAVKILGKRRKLLGVITLYITVGGHISEREQRLIRTIANTLGSLIEIKNAEKAALAAEQAKSEFLANMGHELRTPLHGILGFSERALKRLESTQCEESDKLKRYMTNVQRGGQRLLELLNDLMDLAKLEAGRMRFIKRNADLADVVRMACDEFDALSKERDLEVQVTLLAQETIALMDEGKMLQVVRNLLSNAIKFSEPGGVIELLLDKDAMRGGRRKNDPEIVPAVHLCVRDHGVGVPENELELIFDRFVQSSKTKTGAGGTGLGLAICQEIVSAHHGRIWAELTHGGGTELHVMIPSIMPFAPKDAPRDPSE
ncbi:GAF domain-containing sensor histidine kinase [Magnetofaba australis]|uniref:histidine kinase n=1 Tax=Magnetofaba australis IT-1 TaxID=1434232 RepID=A0A1Y2K5Z0_9PROT|nr:GAF domain-containing sensor histidine kinase [Magnetofaba australis]OSM04444.1 putative histidine kinase [Magnetofaba australis IT-1]